MISFLHTADLQIGKPFHWANDRARPKLRERREQVLDEIARVAAERDVDFVLIAGDFFEANTIDDDVVVRSCARLKQFTMPVIIIPGNHDYAAGPGCVFARNTFTRAKPDLVHVLTKPEPFVLLDGQVVILPAPVKRRDEVDDPTSHITGQLGREEAPDAVRIGLAHGGVVDFSGGGEALSRIDPERATQAELDYLALGDWHGCKQINPRTWYSGTPEVDSFQANDPGYVLHVELSGHGATPHVEQIKTSMTDWLRYKDNITTTNDLEVLQRWFQKLERPLDTLVRLELSGSLNFKQMEQLDQTIADLRNTVLHVRQRGEEILPEASEEEIDAIATDGYLRTAVERLKNRTQLDGEEGAIAKQALQQLYSFKHTGS